MEEIVELERMVDEYQKLIPKLRGEIPQWISVKDALPKEEQDVLVLIRETERENVYHSMYTGYCYPDENEWYTHWCFGCKLVKDEIDKAMVYGGKLEVTHWMPLPDLPEETP